MANPRSSSKLIDTATPQPRFGLLGSSLVILLTTLISAAIAIAGYRLVRSTLLESIKQNALLEVKREADAIDRWLAIRLAEVQAIASNPTVRTLNWDQIHPYFDQEVDRIHDFASLTFALPNGQYYNSYIGSQVFTQPNVPGNIADRTYFQKAMAGEANISDPFISRSMKMPSIAIAAPVWQDHYRSRAPIAEVHAQVKVDRMAEVMQGIRYGNSSYSLIVNRNGEAIIHPDRNLMTLIEKPAPSLLNHKDAGFVQLAQLMSKGEYGIQLTQIEKQPVYIAYVPLPSAKWAIGLSIPQHNIESKLASLNLFALFLATLPIVAAVFAAKQLQLTRQAQERLDLLQNQKYNLKRYQRLLRQQARESQTTLENLQRTQSQLINSQVMLSLGQLLTGVIAEIKRPSDVIAQQVEQNNQQIQLIDRLLPKLIAEQRASTWQERQHEMVTEAIATIDQSLQTTQTQVQRIHSLLQALQGLSQSRDQLQSIRINRLMDDAIRLLEHRLTANRTTDSQHHPHIRIVRQYAEVPLLECHPAQINQILLHLLNNAIDAIEARFYRAAQTEQPLIRVRTQLLHSGQILIRITDNGAGIAEAHQPRLFTPFFTTKPQSQSTGLGLFICQNVVQRHRGTIRCISIPNRGTDFLIELPLRQARNVSSIISEPSTPLDAKSTNGSMSIEPNTQANGIVPLAQDQNNGDRKLHNSHLMDWI
jgi:two-component system, NtrC family, sensor kinase